MNPRIQVEHTVTEVVTGMDLVRSQILVAQGHALHEAPILSARQDDDPTLRLGAAVPSHHGRSGKKFRARLRQNRHVPFTRGIRHSPGWWHGLFRCDLSPFYDSLLVKVTAWGITLPKHASAWIARCVNFAFAA